MSVYVVIEHDPYLPKEGFDSRIIALFTKKENAKLCAAEYNKCFAPYYYTVHRAEVQ